MRSKRHAVGALVDPRKNQVLQFESILESDLLYILLTQKNVADVWEQPTAVEYVDEEGVSRQHTFDFLATIIDGQRIAIAVKPEELVESSGIRKTIDLIEEQSTGEFADTFCYRTEAHITREAAFNGRVIHRCRRMRDEAKVEAMARFVSGLNGAAMIGQVALRSRMAGNAFAAIVNLIDDGVLNVFKGRIDHDNFVYPAKLNAA